MPTNTNNTQLETQLREDFAFFLACLHHYLNLPEPTPIQLSICDYLQNGGKRIITEAFRGVGKSHITAAFAAWNLYRNPQVKILVISATQGRADSFSRFVKRLIGEIPFLHFLQPQSHQRNSNIEFDVAPAKNDQSPSVKSASITGQITGSRADIIIGDDLEIPRNSATESQREKLLNLVGEFNAILKPHDDARIIYLGTPQTQQSLYNKLAERNYDIRVWTSRIPCDVDAYQGRLAPYIHELIESGVQIGQTTEPRRFSDADLLEREASYGRTGFALQFQLDTTLSDALKYPLKLNDLMVMDLDEQEAPIKLTWASSEVIEGLPNLGFDGDRYVKPMKLSDEWSPYSKIVMSIDPSGSGGDKTAYAVVAALHGFLFVLDAGNAQGGYNDNALIRLSNIAKRWGVHEIIIEKNFGDGMFTTLFKPVLFRTHNCYVEEVHHSTQKEKRIIDTLEPVMNRHKLVFNRCIVENDYRENSADSDEGTRHSLMYQLTHISKDRGSLRNDDSLDALAIAVAHHQSIISIDEEIAEDSYILEKKLAAVEAFLNEGSGGLFGKVTHEIGSQYRL